MLEAVPVGAGDEVMTIARRSGEQNENRFGCGGDGGESWSR